MEPDELYFFECKNAAGLLYEALKEKMCAELGEFSVKVLKSQISFKNRHMFGCVSFLRPLPARLMPETYLTLTFGLGHEERSPRISVASEPYPGRWTHHVVIGSVNKIDAEMMDWLREAYDFSNAKR